MAEDIPRRVWVADCDDPLGGEFLISTYSWRRFVLLKVEDTPERCHHIVIYRTIDGRWILEEKHGNGPFSRTMFFPAWAALHFAMFKGGELPPELKPCSVAWNVRKTGRDGWEVKFNGKGVPEEFMRVAESRSDKQPVPTASPIGVCRSSDRLSLPAASRNATALTDEKNGRAGATTPAPNGRAAEAAGPPPPTETNRQLTTLTALADQIRREHPRRRRVPKFLELIADRDVVDFGEIARVAHEAVVEVNAVEKTIIKAKKALALANIPVTLTTSGHRVFKHSTPG
jgi:hypothetical protein